MSVEFLDPMSQYRDALTTGADISADYGKGGWVVNTNGFVSTEAGLGRFSENCPQVNGNSVGRGFFTKGLSAVATRVIGMSMKFIPGPDISATTTSRAFIRLGDAVNAVTHLALCLNADLSISVVRNVTIIGTTAPGVINSGAWHHIEIGFTIDGTVGAIDIRIDNTSVLNLTGVNTRNGGAAVCDTVTLRGPSTIGASSQNTLRFGHFYSILPTGAAPTTFIGDSRIRTLVPSSDAAVAWTRSSGANNFDRVNTLPLNLTNSVSSSTPGQVDRYNMTNLPAAPAVIHAVAILTHFEKDDAGARTVRNFIRSGATTANGTTITPIIGGAYRTDIYATDPATGLAWNATTVNALTGGVEVVS